MKRLRFIILIPCLVLALVSVGCAGKGQVPPPDIPALSQNDVISIAQEHSITSPLNHWEKQAGFYARLGGTQGWFAKYMGNGKWTIELLVRNEDDSLTVYRWSVVEANLVALFLGAYKGSLIK